MGCHNDLTWYRDYPFKAVNWAVAFEGVPLEKGEEIFNHRCVIGGFDNNPEGVLYSGTREEVEKETAHILEKQAPEASSWAPTAPCPRTSIPKDSTGSETPLPLSA